MYHTIIQLSLQLYLTEQRRADCDHSTLRHIVLERKASIGPTLLPPSLTFWSHTPSASQAPSRPHFQTLALHLDDSPVLPGPLLHGLFAASPGCLPQHTLLTPHSCQFLFQSLYLIFNLSYHRRSDIKVDYAVVVARKVCVGSIMVLEGEVPVGIQVLGNLEGIVANRDRAPLCEGAVEVVEG